MSTSLGHLLLLLLLRLREPAPSANLGHVRAVARDVHATLAACLTCLIGRELVRTAELVCGPAASLGDLLVLLGVHAREPALLRCHAPHGTTHDEAAQEVSRNVNVPRRLSEAGVGG